MSRETKRLRSLGSCQREENMATGEPVSGERG